MQCLAADQSTVYTVYSVISSAIAAHLVSYTATVLSDDATMLLL
jgi:hypothetical protein